LWFSKYFRDESNKDSHSDPGFAIRSVVNVFSFFISGIIDTDTGDSWEKKAFVADFVFAEWFGVFVYWEVFESKMHEESKREMDVDGAGGQENDLDDDNEKNGNTNAFKEIFGDKERDEAYESNVSGEK